MNDIELRRRLIQLIINEIVSYFNVKIHINEHDRVTMAYRRDNKSKIVRVASLYNLLDFCGVSDLSFRYRLMPESNLFDELGKVKYFNYNMFKTVAKKRALYEEGKGYNQALADLTMRFFKHIRGTKNDDDNYYFTKHNKMHIRALDYFFGFNIEETLDNQRKSLINTLLSRDKVIEYIKGTPGFNTTEVRDDMVKTITNEIVEMADAHYDGGIEDYLIDSTVEVIKNDVQSLVKHKPIGNG